MKQAPKADREKVLDAFILDFEAGPETLEKYVRNYPEYKSDLEALSQELSRESCMDDTPLSAAEEKLISRAWEKYKEAALSSRVDVFAAVSPTKQQELSTALGVPRSVISSLKSRAVIISSLPRRVIGIIASSLNTTAELVVSSLEMTPTSNLSSYKADQKPETQQRVSFERLLIDAGVPADVRAKLLTDDE